MTYWFIGIDCWGETDKMTSNSSLTDIKHKHGKLSNMPISF